MEVFLRDGFFLFLEHPLRLQESPRCAILQGTHHTEKGSEGKGGRTDNGAKGGWVIRNVKMAGKQTNKSETRWMIDTGRT